MRGWLAGCLSASFIAQCIGCRLTLQVGQGFKVLRTRRLRPVAAPASCSSAMLPNFLSRHGLQKLWPAGTRKSGNECGECERDRERKRGVEVASCWWWPVCEYVTMCLHKLAVLPVRRTLLLGLRGHSVAFAVSRGSGGRAGQAAVLALLPSLTAGCGHWFGGHILADAAGKLAQSLLLLTDLEGHEASGAYPDATQCQPASQLVT